MKLTAAQKQEKQEKKKQQVKDAIKAWEARQRKLGFMRTGIWIHSDDRERLINYAARLRKQKMKEIEK